MAFRTCVMMTILGGVTPTLNLLDCPQFFSVFVPGAVHVVIIGADRDSSNPSNDHLPSAPAVFVFLTSSSGCHVFCFFPPSNLPSLQQARGGIAVILLHLLPIARLTTVVL